MYPNYQPNGIIWVQGIEGAKAYQLMPAGNAVLMDSENDGTFYIKTCDNIGMCSLRTFKFTEVKETTKADYITRDEFLKAIEGLKNERFVQEYKQPAANAANAAEYANKSADKSNYGNGKK